MLVRSAMPLSQEYGLIRAFVCVMELTVLYFRQMPSDVIRNQGMRRRLQERVSCTYSVLYTGRHNGVILEPQEPGRSAQSGEDSGSRSSSRSGTPADSNAEAESASSSPQVPASQPNQNPSGPSSYYRPHTMHTSRSYLSFLHSHHNS